MNCKPGDLAIVVYVADPTEQWAVGRVTRCISSYESLGYTCWHVEPPMKDPNGHRRPGVWDFGLRPLRDNPGADETLSWKSVPSPIKEQA